MFLLALIEAKESGKTLRVVCTILPIYSLTLNVVGKTPGIQVELLLPGHQGCPHNYDLTPGDLIKLKRADLIVANGLGMEKFLDQFINKTGAKAPIILAAEKIEPVLTRPVPNRLSIKKTKTASAQDHDDKANGHAWVSPKAAAFMVQTIAEGLARQDPDHAQEYRFNGHRYSVKLNGLAQQMKEVVSRAKNKKVIVSHDVLAYLARDIDLTIIGIIQAQPGVEPSLRDLARLVKVVKDLQPTAIFSEPQYSDKVALALSKETGVPIFEFDPVATGKPAADTYERIMKRNLEILRIAIK